MITGGFFMAGLAGQARNRVWLSRKIPVSDMIASYKVLRVGILSLVLVLGITRFVYAPPMQQQVSPGIAEGGRGNGVNPGEKCP